MADHEIPPPIHGPHDDVPRGGSWARWTAISLALVLAVAIAPQSWKLPLGILSILALLVGLGKLVLTKGGERDG
jgi:hypothetical protein